MKLTVSAHITQQSLSTKINSVRRAEKVTKARLSELSRELLTYVAIQESEAKDGMPSYDVGMVNRLLAVLTPVNKKVACLYFANFLPWKLEETTCVFTKRLKKVFAEKQEAMVEWLSDEANDIWKWAEDNVKIDEKPKDYAKRIASDVKKALEDETEEGLDASEVLRAVMSAGIDINDLLALLNAEEKAA